MKIKSIKLKNFRQFQDAYIELSQNSEKPFTIILGKNTAGKSTLIGAFLWVLYNLNIFEGKGNKKTSLLLNKDIELSSPPFIPQDTVVEINLEKNGATYKIKNQITYSKSGSGVWETKASERKMIKSIDGNAQTIDENYRISSIINEEILDISLKDYFFYDGENNRVDNQTVKHMKEAVSKLMGIPAAQKVRSFFDSSKSPNVQRSLNNEKQRSEKHLMDSLQKESDKELIQDKLDKVLSSISNTESEIEILNFEINKKESILDGLKEQHEQVQERDKIKKIIDSETSSLKKDFDGLKKSIYFGSGNIFLNNLFTKTFAKMPKIENIKESFDQDKFLADITASAIDQIIKRGICICGTKVDNHIKHELECSKDFMAPKNYVGYLSRFFDQENNNINFSNDDRIRDIANRIIEKIREIEKLNNNLKLIENNLKNFQDTRQLVSDIKEYQGSVNRYEGMLILHRADAESYKRQIDKINAELRGLESNTEQNNFLNKCIEYAREVFELLDNDIRKKENNYREELQEIVNSIFRSIFHAETKGIKISNKYEIYVQDDVSGSLDKSSGEEVIMNFSLVLGLIEMVKLKISQKDNNQLELDESTDDQLPLVLDAPFSHLDDVHIEKLCDAMSRDCNQIFIAAFDKDFSKALKLLRHKIGVLYEIVPVSTTVSRIVVKENV